MDNKLVFMCTGDDMKKYELDIELLQNISSKVVIPKIYRYFRTVLSILLGFSLCCQTTLCGVQAGKEESGLVGKTLERKVKTALASS